MKITNIKNKIKSWVKGFTSWLQDGLTLLSQTGNWLTGGDPDISISARLGYLQVNELEGLITLNLRKYVNFTFYPFEGDWEHCKRAYMKDKDEKYEKGSWVSLILISLIAYTICLPLSLIGWGYILIKRKLSTDESYLAITDNNKESKK